MDVSKECTFCGTAKETMVHVYWDCVKVQPIWTRIEHFIKEYIADDETTFNMITCMLNDFKEKVIILIVNIVKY